MMTGRAHSGQGDLTSVSPEGTDGTAGQAAAAMPPASLVEVVALEVGLADYASLAPVAVVQPADLGDLLSDALFGEVIDISDLIPRLQPSSEEAAVPAFAATEALPGPAEGGEMSAAADHAALTILYDDDILASDGTFL